MLVINLLGFFALNCILAEVFKEKIVSVLQISMGIWMLILFGLAFFQKLNYIDIICAIFLLFLLGYIVGKKISLRDIWDKWFDATTIILFIVVAVIFFFLKGRMAYASDELGVWVLEVKDFFYVNGFSSKYMNLSTGYGDYFPGQMLLEWWPCHFSPNEFKEGYMYVGYWAILIAYIAPVFEKVNLNRVRSILFGIIFGIVSLLIPSMFDVMGYGIVAELPMSAAFAGGLWAIFDTNNHKRSFVLMRLFTSLSCLMLFKESGEIFAVMIFVFEIILLLVDKRGKYSLNSRCFRLITIKDFTCIFLLAEFPVIIWKIFCKIYERTTYFTTIFDNTLEQIGNQTYTISEMTLQYIESMIKAIIFEPLNTYSRYTLNLTVWMTLILVCALCFYCLKRSIINKTEAKLFVGFYIVMLIIYMILLLCMHIFIFQESGYVQPKIMIVSISRYAEPLFLGIFVFLLLIIFNSERKNNSINNLKLEWCVFFVLVLVCCNKSTVKKYVFSYDSFNKQIENERSEVMSKSSNFIDGINSKLSQDEEARILWVKNTSDEGIYGHDWRIICYMLAPKSLYSHYIEQGQLNKEDFMLQVWSLTRDAHCGYVFFDNIDEEYLNALDIRYDGTKSNILFEVVVNDDGTVYYKGV